jgi:hypothetical protein
VNKLNLRLVFGNRERRGKDFRKVRGRFPLCIGEDVIHVLLKCSETRKWREEIFSTKWFIIDEEVAYKRIINCGNFVELWNTGPVTVTVRSETWVLAGWLLESCVRIPLKAWIFIRFFLCCPVSVEDLRRADHSSKESYHVSK